MDAAVAKVPPADAPTVGARADKATVNVGDPITVTVSAVGPRSTPVNLPASIELSPFSILEKKEEEKDLGDGRMVRTFTLKVAAYEPGDVAIPAIEVTYLGKGGVARTVSTAPIAIKISSLLANEDKPELKENAPPVVVMEENRWPYYVAGGLAAGVVGGILALIIRRRLRNRVVLRPQPPPRPAHELALERLDRLGTAALAEGTDLRPFYFELSEIIRTYLGGRWGFDGVEMTVEEISVELRRRAPHERLLIEIEGWLGSTDLVKFAKISPSSTEARGALEDAIRIVESTRPAPVVPTVGPSHGS